MPQEDWLVGDRQAAAAERIYAAATELIARGGYNALDIDVLAARVHCSRATVYRHVGGKRQIADVILARAAERVVAKVRKGIEGLAGRERVVTAIAVGLEYTRTDPLGRFMAASLRGVDQMNWLTDTPVFADLAIELVGAAAGDRAAGQWVLRVVLALIYWPVEDYRTEREVIDRFVGPAFDSAA
ncbi:TetR/AcrR family transcriptional regulator [Mycolicibacterium sp. CBMA 226]|jgi:AcrR family transcriptional regulator|uniref:TetR/AcrR family transcriptional regulator n=1 Tax=Mycolicibacterium sp. CBMA 226 TaxID=2606611 RepID=UPI0012DF1901|nr:TetR/AcrR family transcriptional regulator [Mycolicibacterium sp. CBMA 226]MUL74551.1 TetR/AcrR family transcriptional regulator [Mycolicibacterium sp. CBMA 226]